MANLLLPESKKSLLHIYRMRLLSLALFFVALFWIAANVFLLPSFLILRANIEDTQAQIQGIQSKKVVEEAKDLEKEVGDARKLLSLVSASTSDKSMAVLFKRVLSDKNAGISISYIAMKDQLHTEIHGVARNRQTLQSFVKNIEHDAAVVHVNSPLSNFIAEKDLDFVLSIEWSR